MTSLSRQGDYKLTELLVSLSSGIVVQTSAAVVNEAYASCDTVMVALQFEN